MAGLRCPPTPVRPAPEPLPPERMKPEAGCDKARPETGKAAREADDQGAKNDDGECCRVERGCERPF